MRGYCALLRREPDRWLTWREQVKQREIPTHGELHAAELRATLTRFVSELEKVGGWARGEYKYGDMRIAVGLCVDRVKQQKFVRELKRLRGGAARVLRVLN